MNEFLKTVGANPDASKAILLIPDIWGMTNYTLETAQNFAGDYNRPCYILDYFYELTGQPNNFEPSKDGPIATGLMDRFKGEELMAIFRKASEEIKISQPKLLSLQVVGFCFGGRLAYLTGFETLVDKIVSFYGAGSVTDGFYQGSSAVAALCGKRRGDKDFKVLGFFGSLDESIPELDRQKIQELFSASQISYEHFEYPVGHAYFQQGRPSFDNEAYEQSKKHLDNFLA